MTAKALEWVSKHTHHLILLLAAVLLAWFTYGYLASWAYGYSSDNALIGLMAKAIAEHGERPIFVWSVGYQGIFLEGYLSALVFHFWGANPLTLSIAPAFYFCLSLPLFYLLVSRMWDRDTAALAVLFTVCSSPMTYVLCMRALPNFSTVCCLGMLMILLHALLVDHVTLAGALDVKALILALLLGITVGFALYTYVLSAYFLLTIMLCSFVIYLYQLSLWRPDGGWRLVIVPALTPTNRWTRTVLWLLHGLCLTLVLLGVLAPATGFAPQLVLMRGKRPVEPLHLWMGGILLHLIVGFIVNNLHFQDNLKKRTLGALALVAGMLIGFSPSLYYWYVLGGRSIKGAAISGSFAKVLERLNIGVRGISDMLNLSDGSWTSWMTGAIFLASFVLFCSLLARSLTTILSGPRRLGEINRGMAFFFLPWVISISFLLSGATVDLGSVRYLIPAVFVLALMPAVLIGWLWRRRHAAARLAAVALAACILWCNVPALMQPWATHEGEKKKLDRLVAALDEREIAFAYGDYWAAYLVSFYTGERIVIEPTYSNHSPHYAGRVKAAQRIGYITRLPERLDHLRAVVNIAGLAYHPEATGVEVNDTWEITVLTRLPIVPDK